MSCRFILSYVAQKYHSTWLSIGGRFSEPHCLLLRRAVTSQPRSATAFYQAFPTGISWPVFSYCHVYQLVRCDDILLALEELITILACTNFSHASGFTGHYRALEPCCQHLRFRFCSEYLQTCPKVQNFNDAMEECLDCSKPPCFLC